MADSPRSARRGAPRWRTRLRALPDQHGHAAFASLGRLWRGRLSSLMSAGVAGIALALPLGLAVLVHDAAALTGASQSSARISVFLETGTGAETVAAARKAASSLPGVLSVRVITPHEALGEFRRLGGFRQALKTLGDNPLPPVLVVTPANPDLQSVRQLASRLRKLRDTDQVVADTQWIARLDAILAIARRAVWVLGALLGLAVVLVIGNTVRLEIQNRRTEIEVQKLVGGTNAFVRRPFLYGGLWYGAAGGLLAWILVEVALGLLSGPIARLAGLYGASGGLGGPGAAGLLAMLVAGAALGWAGALLAVGRHLRAIEPG